MSASARPLWWCLERPVSKWPERKVVQGRISPTTERRLAPSAHRHSNFVPVENRPLQAAPPSFSIGSPPGWVMWCLPHTWNCCTFAIGLSSIPCTTRNLAGEPAQDRRQCEYRRHPPQPRSIVSCSTLCRRYKSNPLNRLTSSKTWR